MSANDKQIAGNHYQGEYQHWDFVTECCIHYLVACATKYVARWRKKNGIQDLQKAIHYLEKANETHINYPYSTAAFEDLIEKVHHFTYSNKCSLLEHNIIFNSVVGNYGLAISQITCLITEKLGE